MTNSSKVYSLLETLKSLRDDVTLLHEACCGRRGVPKKKVTKIASN